MALHPHYLKAEEWDWPEDFKFCSREFGIPTNSRLLSLFSRRAGAVTVTI